MKRIKFFSLILRNQMNIMIKIVHLLLNLIDQSYQMIKNIYNNLRNQLTNN